MTIEEKELCLEHHGQRTEVIDGILFVREPCSSEFNDDANVEYWLDVTLWTRRQLYNWLGY